MKYNRILKAIISSLFVFPVLLFFSSSVSAQTQDDCEKMLDKEPYFVRHKSGEKDKALLQDIAILKHCGDFSPADSSFLKGSMLGVIMLQEVRAGKPATYRTIVNFFQNFRKTAEYKDFIYGVSLYRQLGEKKVNPESWEQDKELFVRMGFTVNDLEDFKSFIARAEHLNLTYMQAFSKYMSEIEGMRVDKK